MRIKTALALALLVLSATAGDSLVSKGMKGVGEITSWRPADVLRAGIRAARNPYLVAGVVSLAVYFFTFCAVLSWADVSLVVPITALSFLLTSYVAERALGEHVSAQRWAGTVLIVIGVILVARSTGSRNPARAAPAATGERPTTNDQRPAATLASVVDRSSSQP